MSTLEISQGAFEKLLAHLSPGKAEVEEAAFLFCKAESNGSGIVFRCIDWYAVPPEGFVYQSAYHIEVSDTVKTLVIQKARKLQSAIVEVHSHVDQYSAAFSYSDWDGFSDFVPHMIWRTLGQPYAAVVFAPSSFDGLMWKNRDSEPELLGMISIGDKNVNATGNSIKDYFKPKWKNTKDK